jgi:thiol-disulfide isomerase/thioredoxin
MRSQTRITFILLVAILAVPLLYAQNDMKTLLSAGDDDMRAGKFDQALKDYEKANKASGGKCSLCMIRMAFTKLYLRDDKAALKLADASQAAASSTGERADAYSAKGQILLGLDEANDKNLAAAEEAFRNARKEDPSAEIFQFHLGKVLLRENKVEEGTKELEGFLEKTPTGPSAEVARQWLKHPTKVKYKLAPEFQVTTIKGEQVSSKTLAGRVVLIDFWATWCPPCRASVPELKDLSLRYPNDKMVIISVSSDDDQKKWKTFVAEKQMSWPQYLDSDEHMTKLFNVHSFPTYIIIDGDGFIRERFVAFDPRESLAHRLKDPLKKMLE